MGGTTFTGIFIPTPTGAVGITLGARITVVIDGGTTAADAGFMDGAKAVLAGIGFAMSMSTVGPTAIEETAGLAAICAVLLAAAVIAASFRSMVFVMFPAETIAPLADFAAAT